MAASQNKTVGKFFNTCLTKKPLFLCDVSSAHDLPETWIELVASNCKRECEIIKTHTWVIAIALGDANVAPVIGPNLSKKIVGVGWQGTTSTIC